MLILWLDREREEEAESEGWERARERGKMKERVREKNAPALRHQLSPQFVKITVAERNHDTELLTQQTYCFNPNVLAGEIRSQ